MQQGLWRHGSKAIVADHVSGRVCAGRCRPIQCVQWQAQTCYDSCLFSTDVPAPPTEREVAGLNLPVFDQEMDARRLLDSVWVGETASKVQVDSAGGAKVAFLVKDCLLSQQSWWPRYRRVTLWTWVSYYGITWRQRGGIARRMVPAPLAGNRRRVGGRCPIY